MKVLWGLVTLVHTTVSVEMAQTMCSFEDVTSLQEAVRLRKTQKASVQMRAEDEVKLRSVLHEACHQC